MDYRCDWCERIIPASEMLRHAHTDCPHCGYRPLVPAHLPRLTDDEAARADPGHASVVATPPKPKAKPKAGLYSFRDFTDALPSAGTVTSPSTDFTLNCLSCGRESQLRVVSVPPSVICPKCGRRTPTLADATPLPHDDDLSLKPLEPAPTVPPRPPTEYRVLIDEEDQARRIQEAIDAFQREAAESQEGLDAPDRP